MHTNFPGLPRKWYVPQYNVLGILAVNSGAIFLRTIFLANLKLFFCTFCLTSPERSSGRDLAIQMSVRCAACAVCNFFVRSVSQKTYGQLFDIWYVGGPRTEGAHAEFWAWHMLIKYLTHIIYAKTCPRTKMYINYIALTGRCILLLY